MRKDCVLLTILKLPQLDDAPSLEIPSTPGLALPHPEAWECHPAASPVSALLKYRYGDTQVPARPSLKNRQAYQDEPLPSLSYLRRTARASGRDPEEHIKHGLY